MEYFRYCVNQIDLAAAETGGSQLLLHCPAVGGHEVDLQGAHLGGHLLQPVVLVSHCPASGTT